MAVSGHDPAQHHLASPSRPALVQSLPFAEPVNDLNCGHCSHTVNINIKLSCSASLARLCDVVGVGSDNCLLQPVRIAAHRTCNCCEHCYGQAATKHPASLCKNQGYWTHHKALPVSYMCHCHSLPPATSLLLSSQLHSPPSNAPINPRCFVHSALHITPSSKSLAKQRAVTHPHSSPPVAHGSWLLVGGLMISSPPRYGVHMAAVTHPHSSPPVTQGVSCWWGA